MSRSTASTTPPDTSEAPAAPRPPRRWLRRLICLLVVLLVLVGLAPNLIAWLGLTDSLAQQALGQINGKVRIGGSSLGWFSAVEVRDVVLTDTEGNAVATLPRITSTHSLLGLALDRSNLGEFVIDRPTLHVVTDETTSNLEQVLANYLKPAAPNQPASKPPVLSLRVHDGTIHLRDTVTKQNATLEKCQAVVSLPVSGGPTATLSASVQDAIPGKVSLDANLATSGKVMLIAEAFPLELLAPVARRAQAGTTLAGRLTGETTLTWASEKETPTLAIKGLVRGQNLRVQSPALQGDTLKLDALDLPIDITGVGPRWTVNQADLRCDVGTITLRGTFDSSDSVDRLLTRPGLTLDARVDLARVARLLPQTLTLREGTTVQEGEVTVKLTSQDAAPATLWKGEVRTSALRAERQGRPLRWDDPLHLTFTSRVRPGELPAFDQFECRSAFLTASAKGSAEQLDLKADLSLDDLVAKLADFVDFGGVALAGRGALQVEAKRTPTGTLQAKTTVEVAQFAYTDRAGRAIREPQLQATLDIQALLAVGQPMRVDTASLALVAGQDLLTLSLREPIANLATFERTSASFSLEGDLARWRMRADGLVRLPGTFQVGGSGKVTGQVSYAPKSLRIDTLGVEVDRAVFRGYGVVLDEPRLVASADSVVVNPTNNRVEVTKLLLSSATLAVNAPQLTLEPQSGGYQVITNGSLNANLARVQQTLQLQSDPRGNDAWSGLAGGTFRCTADGTQTQFGIDLDVQNFAYGAPQSPLWKEAQMKITTTGTLDTTREKLRLESLHLGRDALVIDARGSLSRWSTSRDVSLTGSLTYDLARLTPQFRDFLGSGFQANGQGKREFSLGGSLASLKSLSANAGLTWQSVRAYGLDLGPGELKLTLANGTLTTNPIEAGFLGGSGKARVQPTVRLDPAPQEATLANGTIIDHARLTPASTANALGYALPVIANSTATEGEFTFILESNRIPLATPTQATLRGKLILHRATVGAGPLTTEIARLLRAPQTSVTLASENVVPIRVEGGRVYHENLTLTINNFTVKTHGSAGLDGSLSLVAEIPAPAGLLGNSNPRIAQALAGRTIPVPIGGTVQRPVLDVNAFQQGIAKMVADAAQDTIKETGRDLIDKGLNKILPTPEKGLPKLPGLEKLLPGFPKR